MHNRSISKMKIILLLVSFVTLVTGRVSWLSLCVCNDETNCSILRGRIQGDNFVTDMNHELALDTLITAPRQVCNGHQQAKRLLLDSGSIKVDTPLGSVGVDQNGLNAQASVTVGPVNLNGNLQVDPNGQASGGASGSFTAPDGSSLSGNVQVDPNGNVNGGASGTLNTGMGTFNGNVQSQNGQVTGGVDGSMNFGGGSSLSGGLSVDPNGQVNGQASGTLNTGMGTFNGNVQSQNGQVSGGASGMMNFPGGSSLSGGVSVSPNGQVNGQASGTLNTGIGTFNGNMQSQNGQVSGGASGTVNLPGGSSASGNFGVDQNGNFNMGASGNFNTGMGNFNGNLNSQNGQTSGTGTMNFNGGSSITGNFNSGTNGFSGSGSGNFNIGNFGNMNANVQTNNGQTSGSVGGTVNLPGGSSVSGNVNVSPNGQVSGSASGNFNMGNSGTMNVNMNLPSGQQQGGMNFDLSGIQGGQSGTGYNPATFFSQVLNSLFRRQGMAGMDQFQKYQQQMMGKRRV